MNKLELHIEISDVLERLKKTEITLIDALSDSVNQFSRSQLKTAISKGAVWHTNGKSTQRVRRLKKLLRSNEKLHFYYDESVLSQLCLPAQMIADFNDYSVWYKPYGMLSQGSKWSDHLTVSRFVQAHFEQQRACFIVHRLDRAATGIILIAHSKKAAAALSRMFENHSLSKIYRIIAHGNYDLDDNLHVEQPIDGKVAASIFSLIDFDGSANISALDVEIKTGRKHQIRKHAAHIGFPVVGDRLHGQKLTIYPEALNLQLCAAKLSFICPLTEQERTFALEEKLLPQLPFVKEQLLGK